MSQVLTRQEAAERLSVSTDTLDRLRMSGEIAAFRVGSRLVRFEASEIDAFIKRQQCQNTPSSRSTPPQTGTSSGSKVDTRAALRRAREIVSKQRRLLQHSG